MANQLKTIPFTLAAIAITGTAAAQTTPTTVTEHFVINPATSPTLYLLSTDSNNDTTIEPMSAPSGIKPVNSTMQINGNYNLLLENTAGAYYFWQGNPDTPGAVATSSPLPSSLFQSVASQTRSANSVSVSGYVVGSDVKDPSDDSHTNVAKLDSNNNVVKTLQMGPTYYFNTDGSKTTKLPKGIGCADSDNCWVLVERNGEGTSGSGSANIWFIPETDWSYPSNVVINDTNFEQSYSSGWFLPIVSDTHGQYSLAGLAVSSDGTKIRVVYDIPAAGNTYVRTLDYKATPGLLGEPVTTPAPTSNVPYALPAGSTLCGIRFNSDNQSSELYYQDGSTHVESALVQDLNGDVIATPQDPTTGFAQGWNHLACVPVG